MNINELTNVERELIDEMTWQAWAYYAANGCGGPICLTIDSLGGFQAAKNKLWQWQAAQKEMVKQAKAERSKNARQTIFDAAAQAGKPQILAKYMTRRCMCGDDQCSCDSAVEYALPDGNTEIQYTCTY